MQSQPGDLLHSSSDITILRCCLIIRRCYLVENVLLQYRVIKKMMSRLMTRLYVGIKLSSFHVNSLSMGYNPDNCLVLKLDKFWRIRNRARWEHYWCVMPKMRLTLPLQQNCSRSLHLLLIAVHPSMLNPRQSAKYKKYFTCYCKPASLLA